VVNELVTKISDKSQKLLDVYEDKDGSRKEEIDSLSGPNEFNEFYKRLKNIKDYHRRYPNEVGSYMDVEFGILENRREEIVEGLETTFTGEESYGRFLDLNSVYEMYINLKQFERIDYNTYVNEFDKFHEIPKEKKNLECKKYLEALFGYLEGFLKRVKPLTDLNKIYSELNKSFEDDWLEGRIAGWDNITKDEMDTDKSQYCVACVKQFAKQSVFDSHLEGAKHKKAAAKLALNQVDLQSHQKEKTQREAEKEKQIALLEKRIEKLAELLGEERENTKNNIERKQARTTSEREEDKADQVDEPESESEDEDERPYNPLNLPIGWDGKPIPYWLYKLHGLGVEYKCEICGNFTYKGRKPFERHFTEWRHSYGLRCLGIPNIKHFAEVTTIEGAKALWAKIQRDKEKISFKPEQEEEYEDQKGNVFNKKTFEDLRRQGLL